MTVPTANDPPSLTKAREQVFQFLSGLVKSSNKLWAQPVLSAN